ncbi:MAG: DUF58 domain-containing protein [Pseudomonadota bacterium]
MLEPEVHYKVPWRTRGYIPGAHPSSQQGGGQEFRHHLPLVRAPDPRRFDIRASLRDPFEQVYVRVYQQSGAIPVYVVADMSASMSFRGQHSKQDTVADFVKGLSHACYRSGDRFGFVGLSDSQSEPLLLPATMNRAAGLAMADQIRRAAFVGKNEKELLYAQKFLGSRRALVFLLSDFHYSEAQIAKQLAALSFHDVVPVVIWDRQEHREMPRFGISRIRDGESGRRRLLFMRPSLRKKISENFAARKKSLSKLFIRLSHPPLFLEDGYRANEVTGYFYQ